MDISSIQIVVTLACFPDRRQRDGNRSTPRINLQTLQVMDRGGVMYPMHKADFEEIQGEARKQRLDKLMKGLKRQKE